MCNSRCFSSQMRYKLVLDELGSKCWSCDRILFDHPHTDNRSFLLFVRWFLPNNTDFWLVCMILFLIQEVGSWSWGSSTWHHCAWQGYVGRNHSCEQHYSVMCSCYIRLCVLSTCLCHVLECMHTLHSYMCRCHVSWQMMTSCLPSSLGRYTIYSIWIVLHHIVNVWVILVL